MITKQTLIQSLIYAAVILLLLVGGIFIYKSQGPTGPHTTALFIGNSFTSVNDLPKMVAEIANSFGDHLDYFASDAGGLKLSDHLQDQTTLNKIQSQDWNYVILQEQSQLPSFPDTQAKQQFAVFAVQFDSLIHQAHADTKVVFYETWGYQNGDDMNCRYDAEVCSFAGMQSQLTQHYHQVAAELSDPIAPVGEAWEQVRETHPEINLYDTDGKHPSVAGTYLAACVFYATLFHKSPVGATNLSLDKTQARILQTIAYQTVSTQ